MAGRAESAVGCPSVTTHPRRFRVADGGAKGLQGSRMDAHYVTSGLELRMRQDDWERLFTHLFPGDNDEHGAILLCGEVTTDNRRRLLVREVVPAIDGTHYGPGTRGYRHLSGA